MRWIKHIVAPLLVVAALAVAIATVFADHASDYGTVSLPQGGIVDLPKGTVKVFYGEAGQRSSTTHRLTAPLSFEVRPAGGGAPLPEEPTAKDGTGELETERSQELGSPGSVANIEVPAAGAYLVRGSAGRPAGGSYLTFGTDPLGAVLHRWKLFAGLLGGALLVILIPIPRRRPHDWAEGPSGWSSDPRAPYARQEPPAPYAG
jgi:hypothetical protein